VALRAIVRFQHHQVGARLLELQLTIVGWATQVQVPRRSIVVPTGVTASKRVILPNGSGDRCRNAHAHLQRDRNRRLRSIR